MADPRSVDRLEVLPAAPGTEPEEAPARRIQALPMQVNLSGGSPEVEMRSGRPALSFPRAVPIGQKISPITSEMPAGEAAKLLRERCANCLHFRSADWQATKKVWENAPPGSSRKIGFTKMAIQLARSVLDRPPEIRDLARAAHDLSFWGLCGALSEERSDLVIVHPEACCPDGRAYYQPRNDEADRAASAVYDRILKAAQGRR